MMLYSRAECAYVLRVTAFGSASRSVGCSNMSLELQYEARVASVYIDDYDDDAERGDVLRVIAFESASRSINCVRGLGCIVAHTSQIG